MKNNTLEFQMHVVALNGTQDMYNSETEMKMMEAIRNSHNVCSNAYLETF
jgi:hypothetical protein